MNIPPGALSGDGTLNISELTGTDIPVAGSNLKIASKVFNITLENTGLIDRITLTIEYDTNKLQGIPADQIGLYYYDEDKGAWISAGGDVDIATGAVTAKVNHFNKFAVLADSTGPAVIPPVVSPPAFSDISGHWARGSIEKMVEMKAVSGYSDGTFKPDNYITRAEFAIILAQAEGWPAGEGAVEFTDAAAIPGWARASVGAAVYRGIITGYEDNTFKAGRLISRAEIAVMMAKAMGKEASDKPLAFADAASVPSWAAGYVSTAANEGIIRGMPGNLFKPDQNATRAEAVAMTARLLSRAAK